MRTSNKILLITFIVCIGALTAINLALYAKYKKGDITIVKKSAEFEQHQLPAIKYVVLKGLGNIHIYPSNSPRLDMIKETSSPVTFEVHDSTLVIMGDPVRDGRKADVNPPENRIPREYRAIDLYIDAAQKITAYNCEITLHGTKDSAAARSCAFDLERTELHIGSRIDRNGRMRYLNNDNSTIFWKDISVNAKQSQVECDKKGRIALLQVSLTASKVKDNDFSIGKLSVTSDDLSSIELHGRNTAALNVSSK